MPYIFSCCGVYYHEKKNFLASFLCRSRIAGAVSLRREQFDRFYFYFYFNFITVFFHFRSGPNHG